MAIKFRSYRTCDRCEVEFDVNSFVIGQEAPKLQHRKIELRIVDTTAGVTNLEYLDLCPRCSDFVDTRIQSILQIKQPIAAIPPTVTVVVVSPVESVAATESVETETKPLMETQFVPPSTTAPAANPQNVTASGDGYPF